MSRFGGRKSRSSSRSSRGRDNGRSSGRNAKRGGYKKGSNGSGFKRIGSLTVPKSFQEKFGEELIDELREDDIQLNWRVYLPEGVDKLVLTHDQLVLIRVGQVSDKVPDFVVGSVTLPPEE